MAQLEFVYNDGGRQESGRKGIAGDCVARAISIAAQLDYDWVYKRLADGQAGLRQTKRKPKAGRKTARNGIYVKTKWFKDFMAEIGFEWVPTMQIGSGCKVHLAPNELPNGRLIVSVSKHYTAVIDQVINDAFDPQRTNYWYDENGQVEKITERCVYGYWREAAK